MKNPFKYPIIIFESLWILSFKYLTNYLLRRIMDLLGQNEVNNLDKQVDRDTVIDRIEMIFRPIVIVHLTF